ncbi:MAG: protein kinase [Fimbriimonas sp.]
MNGPPTTLGQYQIIREIARSNDVVYEAYDPLMNRRVAVKELAVPGGSTPQQKDERISRFKREAQAAGTLNHPNIMTVFSFAEDAGRIFMAMEYLDGVTLRNEIDTKGFVPAERAVDIASQVLEGLGHAHSKGVVQRDIKPDNIQLLTSGTVKITDFGIARLTFQPNLTMDGQVFGTPSYMSPEQVVGKDIDARSDLFSVGVLLYEMISGTKPFSGDSVVSITYAIMNTEPAKPQQCSDAMWQVVRKAIDKSPMLRYNSAADMLTALKDAYKMDEAGTGMNQMFNLGQQQQQTSSYQPYQQNIQQQPSYVYNPYTNQSMPIPPQQQNLQAPPIQTPYMPQQQQPYVNQPYGYQQPYNQQGYIPQGTMPPPGFPPVYYPPPPRQPLMKPETADFLRRLVIALIIMGTLFAVILVGLNMLVAAFQNYQAVQQDGTVVTVDDPRMSLDERIQRMEKQKSQFQSPAKRDEQDQKIAVLLAQQGQEALKNGSTVEAEKLFKDAVTKDQNNAALYSYLGKLYESQAKQINQPELWSQAAENWQAAWAREADMRRKSAYGDGAAVSYYRYAILMLDSNEMQARRDARHALQEARTIASAGSEIYNRVTDLLNQLEGR